MKKLLSTLFILTFIIFLCGCETTTVPPIDSETQAPSPRNLFVNNSTLYWDNVAFATSYRLTIFLDDNTEENEGVEHIVYTNNYNFSDVITTDREKVSFNLSTLPVNNIYDLESVTVNYQYQVSKIAPTPTNLKVSNKVLSWDVVSGANNYKLTTVINNVRTDYTLDTNSFDFSSLITEEVEEVTFEVITLQGLTYNTDSEVATYTYTNKTLTISHQDYYQDVLDLTGNALAAALTQLMNETHTTKLSYGETRYLFQYTDTHPTQTNKIVCIYSNTLVTSQWDGGNTWNREHVWPQSRSNGLFNNVTNSHRGAGSDLHMLRPETPQVNTSRGNKTLGTGSGCYNPRDEVKGDVARILFYMSIHYNLDIESTGVAQSISMLLAWNKLDPVDDFEYKRNETVKDSQGNYNPFVDCPEFAEMIWGK